MNTGKYTCLEIFARGAGAEGRVRVVSEKYGKVEKEAGDGYYAWLKFSLEPWEDYEISCESCEVSFCYLSGNRDILEAGVLFLERDGESGVFAAADRAGWYDHPLREAYHFSPWKNWSNIWRDMKGLCESAGVDPGKVFPHNLRHLFARTYYSIEKDLSRLADILGHSNINTTRIYTMESGAVHARQIERLGLTIT